VRLYVSSPEGAAWELLVTGPKWFDTRAGKGGGGGIDLVMHLLGSISSRPSSCLPRWVRLASVSRSATAEIRAARCCASTGLSCCASSLASESRPCGLRSSLPSVGLPLSPSWRPKPLRFRLPRGVLPHTPQEQGDGLRPLDSLLLGLRLGTFQPRQGCAAPSGWPVSSLRCGPRQPPCGP
jgi:hypothetical protein